MPPTITLLDGGLGQELIKRSSSPPHPLWSTHVLINEPQIVSDVHRDYCTAGARVICLNTYTITRHRLGSLAPDKTIEDMLKVAFDVAKAGIDAAEIKEEVSIVSSLPPLKASYDHTVAPSFQEAYEQYSELISLQKSNVNGFLLETMSNIAEATAGSQAMRDSHVRGAVSFTLDDTDPTKLRSGEFLEDAIRAVISVRCSSSPDAILINCSRPEIVTDGLKILAAATAGVARFGAYANGFASVTALTPGGTVDCLASRKDLGPREYLEFVKEWIEMGATIVGGCCEIGPEHIRAIRDYLDEEGFVTSSALGAHPR